MKKLLLATISLLLIANTASAQFFRVVSDPVNQECYLGPAGFNDHAAIILKFTNGNTGARFKIHVPPGSGIFSVSSPYTAVGDFTDLTINYGTCLVGGTYVIASFVSTLVEGYAEVAGGGPDGHHRVRLRVPAAVLRAELWVVRRTDTGLPGL